MAFTVKLQKGKVGVPYNVECTKTKSVSETVYISPTPSFCKPISETSLQASLSVLDKNNFKITITGTPSKQGTFDCVVTLYNSTNESGSQYYFEIEIDEGDASNEGGGDNTSQGENGGGDGNGESEENGGGDDTTQGDDDVIKTKVIDINGARTMLEEIKKRAGEQGAAGKSAYAYAVDGGFTGTEAEFAARLAEGGGTGGGGGGGGSFDDLGLYKDEDGDICQRD